MIAKSRADYWADLDRAIEAERALHGQKHLKDKAREPEVKETKVSRTCPLLASCTSNAKAIRTITRHFWQDARERTDARRLTAWGKAIYERRKETVDEGQTPPIAPRLTTQLKNSQSSKTKPAEIIDGFVSGLSSP